MRSRMVALVAVLSVLGAAASSGAQEIRVAPYVQDVTPTSAWILWETTTGEESRVTWGPTDTLGTESTGAAIESEGDARVHEVQLTGLTPATRYYYRAHTGTAASETVHFRTPPLRGSDVTFRLVAMSDMQIDRANPEVYREVIHDGIIDLIAAGDAPELDDALAFVLLPGDLVDNGDDYESWARELFTPGADLMGYVPFYPVLGNHENNSDYYYRYFHLPDNGSSEDPERWWRMDYANVRVIGVDSNLFLLAFEQEAFLDAALDEACADDAIDFVFLQMHHPHLSELWPPGEWAPATQVVERLNRFGDECHKPVVHFYGHTHGYSRGGSRDQAHLWINVASAGGNIDYWGEYSQRDYEEVSVSQDEWGFVVVDVTGGDDPMFHLRRYSRGNETARQDNVLRDEIVVRRYNEPPPAPSITMPVGTVTPACSTARATAFSDPDGDLHGATHWQVSRSCDDFETLELERYRNHENWYDGVDTQAGDDLTDEPLDGLEEGVRYCWRVRYRDRGLAWSDWSEPELLMLSAEGVGTDGGCVGPEPPEPPPVTPDAGVTAEPPSPGCGCRLSARSGRSSKIAAMVWLLMLSMRRRRDLE